MGTGHLMRALALAQAWKENGGETIFLTNCQQPGLLQRLYDEKFLVHHIDQLSPSTNDWKQTAEVARNYPDSWFVLDGYHFGFDYQQSIRNAGFRLLIIDDMAHLSRYTADILVNQNPGATKLRYNLATPTELLFGSQYCLLRREFRGTISARNFSHNSRKIMVTAGGSDPHNVTVPILEAFSGVKEKLEIVAVAGAANRNEQALQAAVASSPHDVKLVKNVRDMSQLMQWADVAISAAGTTALELASMGVPSVLISLFDNQKSIGAEMAIQQAALHAGELPNINWKTIPTLALSLLNDKAARQRMSERARQLVDGRGGERITLHLKQSLKKVS